MSHYIALSVRYVLPSRFGDVFIRVDQSFEQALRVFFCIQFCSIEQHTIVFQSTIQNGRGEMLVFFVNKRWT